jgi:hypothetical protein
MNWFDEVPLKWFEFKYDIIEHSFQYCSQCDFYGEKQSKDPRDDFIIIKAPFESWTFICGPCWSNWSNIPDEIDSFDNIKSI